MAPSPSTNPDPTACPPFDGDDTEAGPGQRPRRPLERVAAGLVAAIPSYGPEQTQVFLGRR